MGERVELVAADGHRLAAYRARPAADRAPGVVVVQEIFGVNDHLRRVVDGFASIEVYNGAERRWEMTPFIYEDGGWKLAVGDAFGNTWKQPGKTQSQREMESSNTMRPQQLPGSNIDFNKIKPKVIDPTRGNVNAGPNPTLNQNVKPVKIPTH